MKIRKVITREWGRIKRVLEFVYNNKRRSERYRKHEIFKREDERESHVEIKRGSET